MGIVYLETALKTMRLNETTRKSVQLRNRREPSNDPVQLKIRKMRRTEQSRQRSSNQSGERNHERVSCLESCLLYTSDAADE